MVCLVNILVESIQQGAVPKQSNLLGAAFFVESMRNDRLWFIYYALW